MIVKAGEYPQELQQWLLMFGTSLINYKCFTNPCFTVMFQKIILFENKTIDQRSAWKWSKYSRRY